MISNEDLGRMLLKMAENSGPDAGPLEKPPSGRESGKPDVPGEPQPRTGLKPGNPISAYPPECECTEDRAYLEGNVEFFLDLVNRKNAPPICPILIRHINNCYRCFEIYSGVMRGFTLEKGREQTRPSEGSV
jgi:hypothetical protein